MKTKETSFMCTGYQSINYNVTRAGLEIQSCTTCTHSLGIDCVCNKQYTKEISVTENKEKHKRNVQDLRDFLKKKNGRKVK
jgi:hypothetical protein